MRHAWVFVLCLYGCTHGAAPDTPHYFSCIPEPANDPLPDDNSAGPDGHARIDPRIDPRIYPHIYHCVRLDPALIYSGPADGSFWGDRFYGPGAMPGYGGIMDPLFMP